MKLQKKIQNLPAKGQILHLGISRYKILKVIDGKKGVEVHGLRIQSKILSEYYPAEPVLITWPPSSFTEVKITNE